MNYLRKFISKLGATKKKARRTIKDYQNEIFASQAREQFKKLVRFGQMPVTLM